MGMPDFRDRPPGARISEAVANQPGQLYIGGLIQRLEREQAEWSATWRKATSASQKSLGQFRYWAVQNEIEQLNAIWDKGRQTISKSDFAKTRTASDEYVNVCLREEIARLEAKLAAAELASKNKQLAELHRARELARARMGK